MPIEAVAEAEAEAEAEKTGQKTESKARVRRMRSHSITCNPRVVVYCLLTAHHIISIPYTEKRRIPWLEARRLNVAQINP